MIFRTRKRQVKWPKIFSGIFNKVDIRNKKNSCPLAWLTIRTSLADNPIDYTINEIYAWKVDIEQRSDNGWFNKLTRFFYYKWCSTSMILLKAVHPEGDKVVCDELAYKRDYCHKWWKKRGKKERWEKTEIEEQIFFT